MNWPEAITICVCAICTTLIIIGISVNKKTKKNDDITNY